MSSVLALSLGGFSSRMPGPNANLAQALHAACNITDTNSAPDWYVDSGASAHMTSYTSALDTFESYFGNGSVIFGNGNALSISYIGSSRITPDVKFIGCLVVPHITKNLLFISKLTSKYNIDVVFSDKYFAIQNQVTKAILAHGR